MRRVLVVLPAAVAAAWPVWPVPASAATQPTVPIGFDIGRAAGVDDRLVCIDLATASRVVPPA